MELKPHTAVWEYTLACDSKCIHCGSNAINPRKDELTTAESLDLVSQLSNLGFGLVVLSGGEPTLRSDWPLIGKEIQKKGMQLGIISNSLAWDNRTIDTLVEINPYSIGFSVDGEKETHDYLRGVAGSHKKVFDSIRYLKNEQQTVCAITTVNKLNLPELVKMRDRMYVFGVDAWQIQMASPMGRMAKRKDLVLDDNEYHSLASFIAETKEVIPWINVAAADCIGYYGVLEGKLRDTPWEGCSAGIYGIGISSNGNILGCLSLQSAENIEGNIREKSLAEIWNNPCGFSYNRKFTIEDLKGKCVGCDYGEKCKGGCQSQSVSFFGEFHNAPRCNFRYEKELAPSQQ
ncbi:MAG: radical SAM protein [archaeon]